MAQHVRALAPEGGDGLADRDVRRRRVAIHVAGVGDFGQRRRRDQVNFRVGEGFESLGLIWLGRGEKEERRKRGVRGVTDGDAEFFGQGVDFGVFEQLRASVIDGGRGGVHLQGSGTGPMREIFARVEIFQEAAGGVEIVV